MVQGIHAVGGIVGQVSNGAIQTSVNKGNVVADKAIANGSQAGGIVGYSAWTGTARVENCYNVGNITSDQYAGGIVSNSAGSGGTTTIINCYSIGTLKGNYSAGGVCGLAASQGVTTFTNNYWLSGCGASYGVGSNSSNTNAKPLSQAQMKANTASLGVMYKADIENKNNGYPILIWE